jgi:hypothetical protein
MSFCPCTLLPFNNILVAEHLSPMLLLNECQTNFPRPSQRMLRFTGCHSCFMELFSSVLKRMANVEFILSSSTYTLKIQSKKRPQLKSLFYSTTASYQSALWIHNVTMYEETTRVQMVFAVTTQTLPRRSSVSQCHTLQGTYVNQFYLRP